MGQFHEFPASNRSYSRHNLKSHLSEPCSSLHIELTDHQGAVIITINRNSEICLKSGRRLAMARPSQQPMARLKSMELKIQRRSRRFIQWKKFYQLAVSKTCINVMVQKCSDSMKETFLETCIANTAHELQKGQNVVGWNMLTQLIAETNPSLVTAHIPRYIELRNSYQNRPVIGQAILWSVGQAGAKSLHSGMKVWLEIMLPVMTMKHYSKFVVNYIIELMQIHKITEATKMNKPVVDLQNFITIQDAVFIVSNQINKEYARNLKQHYPALRAICVAGCSNHEMFPELLPRLSTVTMPDQMLDTLELLSQCLVSTQAAIVHWHKLYTSNLAQSAQLIQYLDTNWTKYKSRLDVPEFHDTLEAFQDYNSSVINKEGLDLAISGCDSLESKFRRGNMSWFPWKTMSLLLLVSTAAIINADIQKHGGKFEKSNVGIFLQDIGQYNRLLILSQVGGPVSCRKGLD